MLSIIVSSTTFRRASAPSGLVYGFSVLVDCTMPASSADCCQFSSDGVDPEVGLRGVLDAERAVAERHQVQVAGEDLRLGERLVQRQRHPDLAQLAGGRRLDGRALLGVGLRDHQQLVVLHVLLLDGRAAAGVERRRDRYPARPVSVPCQSTPLCSANRLSSIETIASFIVLAIWSLGTSKRRCVVQPGDGCCPWRRPSSTPRDLALDELPPSRWRRRRTPGWTSVRSRRRRETAARRSARWPAGSTRRA